MPSPRAHGAARRLREAEVLPETASDLRRGTPLGEVLVRLAELLGGVLRVEGARDFARLDARREARHWLDHHACGAARSQRHLHALAGTYVETFRHAVGQHAADRRRHGHVHQTRRRALRRGTGFLAASHDRILYRKAIRAYRANLGVRLLAHAGAGGSPESR